MYFYTVCKRIASIENDVAILVIMEDVFLHLRGQVQRNLNYVAILVIMEDVFLHYLIYLLILT